MDSQLSKSEKKRRAKGLEELVSELAALSPGEIASLPCEEEVRKEIAGARNCKGGARQRQLKYATKLLRDKPVEELYDFMARKKGSMLKDKREFQELEHFRNLLVTEALQLYEEKRNDNGFLNENDPGEFLHGSETLQTIAQASAGSKPGPVKKCGHAVCQDPQQEIQQGTVSHNEGGPGKITICPTSG